MSLLLAGWWMTGGVSVAAEPRFVASSEGGVLRAELEAVVPYPADDLWRPLTLGTQHAWVPYMKSASLQRLGTNAAVCSGRTKLPWPLRDRSWAIRMSNHVDPERGRYVAAWDYVEGSGNLNDTHGNWVLEHLTDGRTRVSLHAFADVGASVPGPLLRWAEKKALPSMLAALIEQAEVERLATSRTR